ncbi:helix-turn-helix domain-containing protein [Halobacteria archaeon HArc-gm2]|nr:helix-turn-helix domain-containing protein [Halobacteria archaeon HArc-gm2]
MTGDGSGNDEECDHDDCSTGYGVGHVDRPRLDEIVAVLTHPVRRRVLTALDDVEEELSVADLATAVVRSHAVGDAVPGPVDPDAPVELRLYHVHLPKLAAADLVTFDQRDMTVRITAAGEKAIRRYL